MVTVPADFTLSESCMELMNQLAVTIYKCAPELARSCSTEASTCLTTFLAPIVSFSPVRLRALDRSSDCGRIISARFCHKSLHSHLLYAWQLPQQRIQLVAIGILPASLARAAK